MSIIKFKMSLLRRTLDNHLPWHPERDQPSTWTSRWTIRVADVNMQPPKPPRSWSDVRSALRYGSVCPQPIDYRYYTKVKRQDEDCLYLNIFAPPEVCFMWSSDICTAIMALRVLDNSSSRRSPNADDPLVKPNSFSAKFRYKLLKSKRVYDCRLFRVMQTITMCL